MKIQPYFIVSLMLTYAIFPSWAQESDAAEPAATAFDLASAAEKRRDYRTARTQYRRACTEGTAPACTALASLHRNGLGGLLNTNKAEDLYEKGCAGGDIRGCSTLAYLYNQGAFGTPDYVASRKYYTIGCEGEDVSACAALGNQLYAGVGGRYERERGKRLMREACAQEYAWACNQLRELGLASR